MTDSYLGILPIVRAAAETGSFSGAARALNYSQPAISQRIRTFEKEIGMPLFVRTPGGVEPTAIGEVLLRHSIDVLSSVEACRREIDAVRSLARGHVRVVAFPSVSATVLPRAIAAVQLAHPGISISFDQQGTPGAVEALRNSTADVAVVYIYDEGGTTQGPDNLLGDNSDITTELLMVDPLFVALPRTHRLAWRTHVELADLPDERWLVGYHAERLQEMAAAAGFTPIRGHAVADYTAALGFVARGLGVTIVPDLARRTVHAPHVVFRELRPAASRSLLMISRRVTAKVPAVATFMTELRTAAEAHQSEHADGV